MAKTLNELFLAFATYGTRAPESLLDDAKFFKLFKDCKMVGKDLTGTDLDIIYSKAGACAPSALLTAAGGRNSTYTGVYAKGGPTNVEASGQLSDLLDRSPADVRGIKK
ncbi:hypothetical protein WJX81_006732 [Elliptochloris bilobata]|uniref:Uncharacterized protein n=1 Tax=Elliptochloris bilobata TaxID=381761 RepID=A0AAW1SJH1_9CHLO